MIKTLKDYFDRQEPRSFPLPKIRKPCIRTKSISWGDNQIKIGLKASKAGRVELFKGEDKVNGLYIQGTDWRELEHEATILKDLVMQANRLVAST